MNTRPKSLFLLHWSDPIAALAFLAPLLAHGQAPAAQPTPTAPFTAWVTADNFAQFRAEGTQGKFLDIATVQLDGPDGPAPGFRFTTRDVAGTAYGEQASLNVPGAVDPGDVLSAHFYMRTIKSLAESGEGVTTVVVENKAGTLKSLLFNAKVANQWKEFNLPFVAKEGFPPGGGRVIFRLGTQKQTIEIASLEVRDYHHAVALSALPMTHPDLTYSGMEPNAPWRAEAEARIAKFRRSALTVQVVDAAGNPAPNVRVEVRQTRHAFGFGSAIDGDKMFGRSALPPDELKVYEDAISANFNLVTIGNNWKWPRWEQDPKIALQASQWCQEHHIALRGHNMVWPSWRHLPASVKLLRDKPDELRAAVLHHVEDVAAAAAPYVCLWDVINETYDNHDLMDLLGQHILVDIFETAKKVDPKALLYINDYNIVSNNGLDYGHQDSYEKVIQYLVDQHAPVEGIGMQCHFGQQFTPPTRILSILDRYAKFHLPIQATEFTLDGDDENADARYMRDVMTVFFSYPSVTAFVFWGSFEGVDYPHKAEIFDQQGQLTTVGKAWHELVFSQWWTHEQTTTAANGTATVQGYHGEYEVTALQAGSKLTAKAAIELKPGGSTLKLVLAP